MQDVEKAFVEVLATDMHGRTRVELVGRPGFELFPRRRELPVDRTAGTGSQLIGWMGILYLHV
jgi:hypothetical protein